MAGAFLVSDFGLLVMILRAFSRDLSCCGDRTHYKKQKSCNPSRYFVFELLEQSRDSTGGCCGPGVGLGGYDAGVVNPVQVQDGIVGRREALRVRVFARALCCVIAFP